MKQIDTNIKFASNEEYFLYEEKSELRHELINGNLYEMSGVSIFHNDIVLNIALLLRQLLKQTNYKVSVESFKVRTPDNNFFYPDVAVFQNLSDKYYTQEPVLIIEVLSEATRKYDLTDKFIQYQKIESLNYYLCVEPEQQVVIFYFRNDEGEWMTGTYTKDVDKLDLKMLHIALTLKDIYKPE